MSDNGLRLRRLNRFGDVYDRLIRLTAPLPAFPIVATSAHIDASLPHQALGACAQELVLCIVGIVGKGVIKNFIPLLKHICEKMLIIVYDWFDITYTKYGFLIKISRLNFVVALLYKLMKY